MDPDLKIHFRSDTRPARMVIEFKRDGRNIRTVTLYEVLPNLEVGQLMTFDHPTLANGLNGRIGDIAHVVYLDAGTPPLTYVDVDIID